MDSLFTYLARSAVSMGMLYLVYALFLRKDTFFKVNRFYLAGSILFSLVIPLFDIGFSLQSSNPRYYYLLEAITITPGEIGEAVSSHISFFEGLLIVYFTGAAIFLIRFIYQLVQLALLIRRSGIRKEKDINFVMINRNYSPFSFFRYIFIGKEIDDPDRIKEIVKHEMIHVRQYHTLDLILLEALTVVQWFNPIIWLYRHSIKEVHEYLADEGVLLEGTDLIRYQALLLGQSLGIQVNDLTNNFNHSLLKRRIIMMTKERSGRWSLWKASLALPVVVLLTLAFSVSVNFAMAQDKSAQAVTKKEMPPTPPKGEKADQPVVSGEEEQVYVVVEQMPEFQGGVKGMQEYLVSNIKYPDKAKQEGIQGRVFVSFVIRADGSVSGATILRGVDPLLDEEALRVVSQMPKWKPGTQKGKAVNVQFNLPIVFKLDEEKKVEEK